MATTSEVTGTSLTTTGAAEEAGRALGSAGPFEKLIVAIHGIGDQYHYATIRSVVARFGSHFDFPAAVPLGSFYAPEGSVNAFRLQAPPDVPTGLGGIGFAEVYWANIPRAIQKKGYTIEEAKAWARTVVERVRARYGRELEDQFNFQSEDFRDAANVLLEMIETIKLLGNLLFLAEKIGFPKFDLDDLLTSYLGDVQLVADFPDKRQKILHRFSEALDALWQGVMQRQKTKPEIYIVAHSEGTVIAFMALLRAMSLPVPGEVAPPARPEWIDQVRGFMTIGSPIDKHLILWPNIWNAYNKPDRPVSPPIKWRNYYDYGDPVGFDLDTARDWMEDHAWKPAFEFEQEHDIGFSRYLLPGAAHNDYWDDEVVFGHFIQTVVARGPPPVLISRHQSGTATWRKSSATSRLTSSRFSCSIPALIFWPRRLSRMRHRRPQPRLRLRLKRRARPTRRCFTANRMSSSGGTDTKGRPPHDLVRRNDSQCDGHYLSSRRHDAGRAHPAPHAQARVALPCRRAFCPFRRALCCPGRCAYALLARIPPEVPRE